MTEKNIQTMTPEKILVKEAFRRVLPSEALTETGQLRQNGAHYGSGDIYYDQLRYEYLTQADFMREFDINGHRINSIKYYPNQLMKKESGSKYYRKVKSRVAIAWQQRIFTKRLATLTGNNVALSIANSVSGLANKQTLKLFREGWVIKDIENAIFEAIASDGKTGDCAICFYLYRGEIGWRTFGFEKGDTIYPHYDSTTGKLSLLGRRYFITNEDGVQEEYLDVWDDKNYARYKMGSENGKKTDWNIDQMAKAHGFNRIPVAYHRFGAPFWSQSQSLIDNNELSLSQLAENNASYALRILTLMGAEMDMESSIDGTPTVINSTDVNAKVGYLEPSDSSASFELQLKTQEKNIMRCSFCVETPDLKGSDISSLTVKMLFADSHQKALEDAQSLQPFLNDVVEIFKYGYGMEIQKISDFNILKVKAEIHPYYFMSETEVTNSLVQLSSVGALSKRSACEATYEILGYGDIDEYSIIQQEEHDKLLGEIQANNPQNIVNISRQTE